MPSIDEVFVPSIDEVFVPSIDEVFVPSVDYTAGCRPVDDCTIAALRVILAVLALSFTYISSSEVGASAGATYTSLTLYVVYSTASFGRILYCNSLVLVPIEHWIDVGWYAMLIGVSHGTYSISFPLFFFAILVASLRWGFGTGLRVTAVSAGLFSGVGFFMTPAEPGFALNPFLIRSTMLVVLGYTMAAWGGFEITRKRQLALLKDISISANPRFGVDRTLGSLLEQLRAFYNADACLFVIANPRTGGYDLQRVDYRDPEAAMSAAPMPESLTHILLDWPATQAAVACHGRHLWAWWCRAAGGRTYDVETGAVVNASPQMRGMPEAGSFITVPIRLDNETVGRLFLTASRRCAFNTADIRFLLQVLDHIMPTVENTRRVHELTVTAAEMERQRIAHDVHDSVIQPYIGLKTGLLGIDRKLAAGKIDVQEDIKQLLAMIV